MTTPYSAVFFDCDGVLVESEPITLRILHQTLVDMGWNLTEGECISRFIGTSFADHTDEILAHTGTRIDDTWISNFRQRRDQALRESVQATAGVFEAITTIASVIGDRFACVSGADRGKITLELDKAGLADLFGNRVFSGMEVPRSKPAPDVYLAAADFFRVDPATTVVIEDSPAGVQAGVAAGATVLGYCPGGPFHFPPEVLLANGATQVFSSMDELPGLVLVSSR